MAAVAVAAVAVVLPTAPATAAPAPGDDGVVLVAGEPLVHTFDLAVPGDAVTGRWQVDASSSAPVQYDALLVPEGAVSPSLARALVVHYGQVRADGRIAWQPAGTLAEPRSYADALGATPAVSAGEPAVIPVRVSLPDPGVVSGEPGDQLAVEATFLVSYLDGDSGDEPRDPGPAGVAAPGRPGALAVTGPGLWAAAVAVVLVGLGYGLRRRAPHAAPRSSSALR
ncbi:hypothetical protein [Cellulomonas sp. GbtcB1]|uniref:hypothetical protein n=1 Tax=Cellulomonas sp. GbtcB1 TaxID=2824746 RepID=UPI001C2FCD50|nr:hypothetical protein [Cellulomonas sp. GbtcB1]